MLNRLLYASIRQIVQHKFVRNIRNFAHVITKYVNFVLSILNTSVIFFSSKASLMKQYYIYLVLFFLFLQASVQAQVQIQNSGMEQWTGFNLLRPDNWSTREQELNIKTNKWVSREMRQDYTHAGVTAIKLTSDTVMISTGNKVAQPKLWSGMIAYGRASYVNGRLVTSGLPVYGRPSAISMYVKISHPARDTASMRLILTRWNPIRKQADTLAIERKDIFPDSVVMGDFALFTDTITYLMGGIADTAHIVISGGRNGNIALRGNTMWVDDISFSYSPSELVKTDLEDAVFIYPNPASTFIKINADADLAGYSLVLLDASGMTIREVMMDEGTTILNVADLRQGSYNYAVVDRDKNLLRSGNINILR